MDYSITHGHLDSQRLDAQQEADLNAWLDAQPEPEYIPVCGQCVHHQAEKRWKSQYTGRQLHYPAHCQLRAIAGMPSRFEASDT